VVLYLRPSRDQVSGDLLRNAGNFIGVVIKGQCTDRTVNETTQPRRRANESQPWYRDIFPQAESYQFCVDGGDGREQVELGSSLRHERRA
jgi:hypothetical protein